MSKESLRALAVQLRKEGRSYNEIRQFVPVSTSTLSLWLRDVLVNDEARSRLDDRQAAGRENAVAAMRARRSAKEARIVQEARSEMPSRLAGSELFAVGLALYWAEGSKPKPWNTSQGVCFINSDPDVIRVFLAWLDLLDVARSEVSFRVSIHESGDVEAAERFWADMVGIRPADLQRTSLKRHETRSTRRLPSESYVGCLRIDVRKSTDFNRKIAGWWQGLVAAVATLEVPSGMV